MEESRCFQQPEKVCEKETGKPEEAYPVNWMDIALGRCFPDLMEEQVFGTIFHPVEHRERLERLYRLIFGTGIKSLPFLKEKVPKGEIYRKVSREELFSGRWEGKPESMMACGMIGRAMDRLKLTQIEMLLSFTVEVQETEEQEPLTYYFVAMISTKGESPGTAGIHYLNPAKNTREFRNCPVCLVSIEMEKCLRQWEARSYPANKEQLYHWLYFLGNVNGSRTRRIVRDNEEMALICEELRAYGRSQGRKAAECLGFPKPYPWFETGKKTEPPLVELSLLPSP